MISELLVGNRALVSPQLGRFGPSPILTGLIKRCLKLGLLTVDRLQSPKMLRVWVLCRPTEVTETEVCSTRGFWCRALVGNLFSSDNNAEIAVIKIIANMY